MASGKDEGTLFTSDGTVYEGFWREDKLLSSTIHYAVGSNYYGSISGLQPHGKGTLSLNKGPYSWYSGCFNDGQYHGHGRNVQRDLNDIVIFRDMWENDVQVRRLD